MQGGSTTQAQFSWGGGSPSRGSVGGWWQEPPHGLLAGDVSRLRLSLCWPIAAWQLCVNQLGIESTGKLLRAVSAIIGQRRLLCSRVHRQHRPLTCNRSWRFWRLSSSMPGTTASICGQHQGTRASVDQRVAWAGP